MFSFKTIFESLRRRMRERGSINPVRDWFILLGVFTSLTILVLALGTYWLFVLPERFGVPPAREGEEYEATLDIRALQQTLEAYESRDRVREELLEMPLDVVDPSF